MSIGDRMADIGGTVRNATAAELAARIDYPRPTGQEIFDSKTKAEQDEMLGPETAQLVRDGEATVSDLKAKGHLDNAPDFITQKPAKDLT